MAQLKDLIVTGATRLIGNAYAGTIQITTLNAPTAAGGTTYGPGTNGYVLKSNGSSVYWGSDNNSVTGVKGNAESSYRTGQVNLTPANIGALALTGGTLTGSLQIKALGKDNFISVPDKHFASADGTKVGAIKITFPVSWTATMMSMKVDIYNYNNDNAITYTIGGYNYTGSGGSWTNCSAQCSGIGDKSNLKVRFAHDGTKCCIIIGEIDTSWSYPKVVIRDILLGHSGTTLTNWIVGWDIGWITELPTNIDVIKENTNITSNYPTKTGVGASGTWGISITGNAATATSATTATTATNAYSLLAFSANEISIGATATPADATNSVIWINYRSGYGGSTNDAATQITEYDFGNRKGNTTGVTLKAANFSGNAATASKLATARTISLTGSVTGSGSFDGSGNLSIATTTNHHHNTLTVGNKTYNGSSDVTIEIADLGLASTTTFLGLTSTNLSNGSTTNPITITVGPTTGSVTATNGGVVMEASSGEEYIWAGNKWNLMGLASSWALANHIHGNITNAGTITSDTAKASGQHLVITDSNNKICRSTITLGTATNTYLRNDGSWATPTDTNKYHKTGSWSGLTYTATAVNSADELKFTVPSASTSAAGAVQLSSAINSTSTTLAATASAVKAAYDLAAGKVSRSGDTMTGMLKVKGLKGTSGTDYGEVLPDTAEEGQIFFQLSDQQNELPDGGTTGQFLRGDGIWSNTLTDSLNITKAGECGVEVNNTQETNPNQVAFIVGESGNGGIFSRKHNKWIVYSDPSGDVVLNGNAATATYATYLKNLNPSGITVEASSWLYNPKSLTNYTPIWKQCSRRTSTGTDTADMGLCVAENLEYWLYIDGGVLALNYLYGTKVYGAVWNDYAEYRETKEKIEPGRCMREVGDDTLIITTERLQKGCEIVSDTFGFAIGESKKAKTPTAASGRVLAYLYEDREIARQHIGDPVCSGPNGTVSIMTEEEEMRYPSRIIGTISAVPDYEIWYAGSQDGNKQEEIKVNGRIWIRIR